MKVQKNKIEAGIFIVLSVLILFYSYKYHIIPDGFLSAGLFPFIVGVLMFIFSCFIFIERTETIEAKKDLSKNSSKKNNNIVNAVTILLLAFVLFFIGFRFLNFYVLSSIYIIIVLLLLKERNISFIILVAIVSNIAIYLIFSLALKIL